MLHKCPKFASSSEHRVFHVIGYVTMVTYAALCTRLCSAIPDDVI